MVDQQTYRVNALAASSQLSLPLGAYRWSGQSGDFAGKEAGASMNFQDHRDYVPGDDPRHINWQAYARAGSYIIKQYQEEVSPTVDVILDASPSMFFTPEKEQRSSELLYLLSACSKKCGAHLHIHLLTGKTHRSLSLEELHTARWVDHIKAPPIENTLLDTSRLILKPGSLRLFISDLLFQADPLSIIRPLTQRGGHFSCFIPYLLEEANPTWLGNYEFQDAETSQTQPHKITRESLEHYKTSYQRHFSLWFDAIRSIQGNYARLDSNESLMSSLSAEAIPRKLLDYSF